jgi:hypothetical protein
VAGRFIASGTGGTSVDCTGRPQSISQAVTPTQRAFARGVAFGQAHLDVCGNSCESVLDQHVIQIVKR